VDDINDCHKERKNNASNQNWHSVSMSGRYTGSNKVKQSPESVENELDDRPGCRRTSGNMKTTQVDD